VHVAPPAGASRPAARRYLFNYMFILPAKRNRSRNYNYNDKSHFYLWLSSTNHALRDELIAYTDLLAVVFIIVF
jgi:hypothetical protein